MVRNTKILSEPLRFSIVPLWKIKFSSFCNATKNQSLIAKAERSLSMMRVVAFGIAVLSWGYLYSIFGMTPAWLVGQAIKGSAGAGVASAILIFLFYSTYTTVLNIYAEKKIVMPNYSKVFKQDDSVPITVAPDAQDGFFALGIDQNNEFLRWKFGAAEYSSNLVITGDSHIFGQRLLNTLMYGSISAEPNTVFLVLNSEEGLEFSWLKYNYSNLLSKIDKKGRKPEDLYHSQWLAEFADLPKLPNVCVVEDYEIPRALDWLYDEYYRRQTLRQGNPMFEPVTRVIIILDWGMTEKLGAKDNGARYSILKSLVRADRRLKFNVIAVCDPVKTWGDFDGAIKHFVSGLEFFHAAQAGKKPEKDDKSETGFQHRTYDIPALAYKCKLYWKGMSRVLSILKCDSDTLAEHIYKQAGDDSPETFALWQAMCNFQPYNDTLVGRGKIRVNLQEPE